MLEEKLILEMTRVVGELTILIDYIDYHNPVLTKAGNLGKKDCFELNKLMNDKIDVTTPSKGMEQYPSIYFWYNILRGLNLYTEVSLSSTKRVLEKNEFYKIYESMNVIEKYIVILNTYFNEVEPAQLYGKTVAYIGMIYGKIAETIEDLVHLNNGEGISINWTENSLDKVPSKYECTFGIAWKLFYSIKSLGLCKMEMIENKKIYSHGEKILISSVYPTYLSQIVLKDISDHKCLKTFLRKDTSIIEDYRNMLEGNDPLSKVICSIIGNKGLDTDKNVIKDVQNEMRPFTKKLENFFQEKISSEKLSTFTHTDIEIKKDNSYIFKVEFKAIPSVWVRMQVDGCATLEQLSYAILEAIGFDDDHLYAFYMDNKPWSNNAYYDPRGNEDGERSASEVQLNELRLKVNKKFLYLYDFGDEWLFTIYCEKIIASKIDGIIILESHGKEVEQYPNLDDDWE